MQAVSRHDIGLAAKNLGRIILYIQKLIQAEPAFFIIEKQIDVRIIAGLAASRRAKNKKICDAEPFQLGLAGC
jgi:hypothetical protein